MWRYYYVYNSLDFELVLCIGSVGPIAILYYIIYTYILDADNCFLTNAYNNGFYKSITNTPWYNHMKVYILLSSITLQVDSNMTLSTALLVPPIEIGGPKTNPTYILWKISLSSSGYAKVTAVPYFFLAWSSLPSTLFITPA